MNVGFKIGVRPKDLHDILAKNKPYIVHFCGHGAGKEGLIFHSNESGEEEQLVSNKALAGLFNLFGDKTECVLLNACTTEIQADAILPYVPYVVGTSGEILDKAAYWFAVGFYTALGWGESIEISFKRGENAIALNLPRLNIKPDIEDHYRKGIVVLGVESSNKAESLKIILKKNSRLIDLDLSADIPSKFVAAINRERIRKNYKDRLRNVLNRFGQRTIEPNQVRSKFECEQRQTLLNKVEEFWIKGFLEPSLHFNPAINKNNKSLEQISYPLDNLEVIPVNPDKSYDKLEQTDILNQIGEGKTLLILGEPGSGKTIALLQLAARLIKPTEQLKPIPVVFNLSSWGEKQQPLEEWLIEELKEKYQVPKALSEPWIKQQQLTLLLDGLDEVGNGLNDRIKAQELQKNCIIAINIFIAEHLETEIVVCSRVEDYEALTEKLLLSSAICIQPFSKEQVLDILKNVDYSLLGLRAAIEKYEEIADFARTPLILNMMTWTYSHWSEERCHIEFRIIADREFNLFESYIRNNLKREDIEEKYPKEKVKHWLSWLAKNIVSESKIIFLIEKLQPSLLINKDKTEYVISNFLIEGLIGVLIGGLTGRLVGVLIGMLIGGLIYGLSDILSEITLFEQIGWSWKKAYYGLIKRLIVGVILGLIGGLIIWRIEFLIGGLIGGLMYGLIFGLNAGTINEVKQKTIPNQGIWNSAKNSIKFGLIYGLIAGVIGWLIGRMIGGQIYGLLFGQIYMLAVGLQNGGESCIKHFNLRRILYRKGYIPWNYARFLDYASERRLMKKIGGGYIFYHRMLMEHFANK